MAETWTLPELVREVVARMEALPAPANGQVRAVPDARTIRYYATLGLLDRPLAMRGRTALYGPRHLAQVIAIKRLQHAGKSLAEIEQLWPTLDHAVLSRMSGVKLAADRPRAARAAFWKGTPAPAPRDANEADEARAEEPAAEQPAAPRIMPAMRLELRLELAPDVSLALAVVDGGATLSPADVHALRVAAAPLLAELANRGLVPHPGGEDR